MRGVTQTLDRGSDQPLNRASDQRSAPLGRIDERFLLRTRGTGPTGGYYSGTQTRLGPDPSGEAATCDTLGYAHHHLGHHRQSVSYFETPSRSCARSVTLTAKRIPSLTWPTPTTPQVTTCWRARRCSVDPLGHVSITSMASEVAASERAAVRFGHGFLYLRYRTPDRDVLVGVLVRVNA